MIEGLEFIHEDMSFQQMCDEAGKSAVSRRAFLGAMAVAVAAGIVLKPEEAYAWNSFNSKVSGPATSMMGLADCVHEDITQIAYSYALYRMVRNHEETTVTKTARDGEPYSMSVPGIPGGLLNPYQPHAGSNGQAPSFEEGDLDNDYDPLPNALYAENVAFLRMGSFWNDSACNSIEDFMWCYARCDAIEKPDKDHYDNVADVAAHMLKDQATEELYGSALIKFSMGERASFLHAMQVFQPDATTKLPQGQCRAMMLQWLGVAWEYARTGNPDGIQVEGLSASQCRMIFDAFIDIYHQCYADYGIGNSTPEHGNLTFEDIINESSSWSADFGKYGSPELVTEQGYGYGGANPLNIRDMRCRDIPLTQRFLRLRALGMFSHTVEDSWCAAHCSRTYPTTGSYKYQIVGFNHYRRQKSDGFTGANRHAPYDQVCKTDVKTTYGSQKSNLRQILTYDPYTPWYQKWDFLNWFPDRYNFCRGTNKLYNFAPGETIDDASGHVYQGVDYDPDHSPETSEQIISDIYAAWYDRDMEHNGADKSDPGAFSVAYPVLHDGDYRFTTLGLSEAINTMAALYELFMEGRTWSEIRPWILEHVLKCLFINDEPSDPSSETAQQASSWICDGGRRSLESNRLLLGRAKKLAEKHEALGLTSKGEMIDGLQDPLAPLRQFVKWQDWAEKFFNEHNDGTSVCSKVDGEGYDEAEGEEFVEQAYERLSACLTRALEINGTEKLCEAIGVSGMRELQDVLQDLGGIRNEFVLQRTGALPEAEGASTRSAMSVLSADENATSGAADFIPDDLRELFEHGTYGSESTVVDLMVTIQAIGGEENLDLASNIYDGGSDATYYRPFMFCNMESLEPFSAWAEVGSDAEATLREYGEKAACITCTFRFFDDNVYGSDFECIVEDVEDVVVPRKAYRVFGEALSASRSEGLVLDIHTLDTDGAFVTVKETFPFEEGFSDDAISSLAKGGYVTVLLIQPSDSDVRSVAGFSIIENQMREVNDDDADDFYSAIEFTQIVGAPVYDVFSNSVSLVTSELDPTEGTFTPTHSYAYYEGGSESGASSKFTAISTISYQQGVLCDVPGQCEKYSDDGDDYVGEGSTMSALVYQDSTIHDMANREYKVTYLRGAPDEDASEPQYAETEQYIDPLYLSYLAVGMVDSHIDICDSEIHYVSDGAGTHTLLCDDYIVHGTEACTDEDGNPCAESGKPCTKCSFGHSDDEQEDEPEDEGEGSDVGPGADDPSSGGTGSGANAQDLPSTGDNAGAVAMTAAALGAATLGVAAFAGKQLKD